MLKHCVNLWEEGKSGLRKIIEEQFTKNKHISYEWLVEQIIKNCLNRDDEYKWNTNSITTIDNGDYQGTLLFLIPRDNYQPNRYDYLMTWIGYGSCAVCDALCRAIDDNSVGEVMTICLHLIQNMTHPYPNPWVEEDVLSEEC